MTDLIEQGRNDESTRIIHDMILDGEIEIDDVIKGKYLQKVEQRFVEEGLGLEEDYIDASGEG